MTQESERIEATGHFDTSPQLLSGEHSMTYEAELKVAECHDEGVAYRSADIKHQINK